MSIKKEDLKKIINELCEITEVSQERIEKIIVNSIIVDSDIKALYNFFNILKQKTTL